jgi:vitamin B12 transporter
MSFLFARPPSGLFYCPGKFPGGENMFLFLLLNLTFHPMQADSTKAYQQREVVVTATRTPINIVDAPTRVTQIDVSEMQKRGFDDIKSILSFADGLFVKDNGPAQLATISLRGTTAQQTLFLFDGVSLNNIQNGQLDLFLVPANNLGSIEISQGGSSALYGANAVGGVVDLESKTSLDNLVRIDFGGGSFGNQMMGGELSEELGPARVDLVVRRQRGINDFDFTFNDGSRNIPMTLTGADYLEDMQSLKFTLPSPDGVTSFLIQNVSADRGTPGAVYDSTFVGTAREMDRNTIAILKNAGALGVFNYSTMAGFVYSYLKYTDTTFATNDYYKTLSLQPSAQISYSGKHLSGTTGIDAEIDRGESDNMVSAKYRNRIGIFVSGEYDLRKDADMETRLFGALRFDNYSEFGSSLNPKVGFNIKPAAALPIHFRANIGTSYRVPTFNDLYYAGLGNTNLKPEKATDYDLGAVAEWNSDCIPFYGILDVDYYHIDIRDGIVWRPTDQSQTIWIPQNFQKIISRGTEVSINLNYNSLVVLKGNYFLGKSLDISNPSDPMSYNKQLIYVPQTQSSFIAEVTPGIFSFTAAVQYVGGRFYTTDNSASSSPYALTYVSASAQIDAGAFEFLPRVSVDDLFNREYEVIPNYPMPGRTYRFSLSLQFNQDK